MSNTIAIDTRIARDILTSLKEIKEELGLLRRTLTRPRYGSELWWEEEIRSGDDEIEKGKYTVYKNAKELMRDLHAGV